jgi:hypothetical protein
MGRPVARIGDVPVLVALCALIFTREQVACLRDAGRGMEDRFGVIRIVRGVSDKEQENDSF